MISLQYLIVTLIARSYKGRVHEIQLMEEFG